MRKFYCKDITSTLNMEVTEANNMTNATSLNLTSVQSFNTKRIGLKKFQNIYFNLAILFYTQKDTSRVIIVFQHHTIEQRSKLLQLTLNLHEFGLCVF